MRFDAPSRRTSIYPLIHKSSPRCSVSVANPDSGRLRQTMSTYVRRCQPPPGGRGAVRRLVRRSFDEGSPSPPSHPSHGFGSLWKVLVGGGSWPDTRRPAIRNSNMSLEPGASLEFVCWNLDIHFGSLCQPMPTYVNNPPEGECTNEWARERANPGMRAG